MTSYVHTYISFGLTVRDIQIKLSAETPNGTAIAVYRGILWLIARNAFIPAAVCNRTLIPWNIRFLYRLPGRHVSKDQLFLLSVTVRGLDGQ